MFLFNYRMELQKVLEKRASVRRFSPKNVKEEDIIEAIEAANLAPSPGNVQILKYILVRDEGLKEEIAECCCQDFVKTAQVIVVVCSDSTQVKRLYDIRAEKYIKHHVGAAVENFLLKIVDLGLASCWVGAFASNLKNILRIPDDIKPEVVLPIGYEAVGVHTSQKRKYSLNRRVFFDRYKNKLGRSFERVRRGEL